MNKYKKILEENFRLADIEINGNRPQDIQILDERAYKKILTQANLGLGESYINGWIKINAIDEFIYNLLKTDLQKKVSKNIPALILFLKAKLTNKQKSKAYHIGEWHYDIGNELYEKMLDKNMQYSCGYWKNAENLDEAQLNKMELIAKKLKLEKGMRVLDIGCGWGGLEKYLAENYKVDIIGITVSKEQANFAQEINKKLPVKILLQDYRELNEKFDRIVSVGMFEHVGYKNYEIYMKTISRNLQEDGLFLLQTIGSNKSNISTDPFIDKYIFPNGMIPSLSQIAKASEEKLVIEDLHNFGEDYDKTLIAWHKNFKKAWPELKNKYNEKFYRMWEYYLLSCAGGFRAKHTNLWQIVFSKKSFKGPYEGVR